MMRCYWPSGTTIAAVSSRHKGFHGAKREAGLGEMCVLRAIRFIDFLESSGRTCHPGEIPIGIQYLDGHWEQCLELGYRQATVRGFRFYIQHFLIWLHRTRAPLKAINQNTIESFLSHDCLCHNYALTPNKLRTVQDLRGCCQRLRELPGRTGRRTRGLCEIKAKKASKTGRVLHLA